MEGKGIKYLFYSSAAILLVIMLIASRNAGISCDEILHYDHSVAVLNYFSSHGADTSALNTPETNLKFYGQSYDNIVTILTRLFHVEDVYRFRNLMSSLMGWLTILVTALFAVWLRNYKTGLITILLFAASPTFFGHSLNNLKDVPFAFAYIWGIWYILRFISKSGKVQLSTSILLTLSIAFCISIRAGGLILVCYLFLFFVASYVYKYFESGKVNTREIIRKTAWISAMSLIAVLLSTILWPYALQDPLRNILDSYKVMAHYPLTFRQIFEGKFEWSDFMPWYYLLKSMAITIPVIVLSGFFIFFIFTKKVISDRKILLYSFLVFSIIFPLVFVIFEKSNLYSSWRQFLFVYPGIVLLASAGLSFLIESLRSRYLRIGVAAIIAVLALLPAKFMIKNHPYEYIYYNELAGGLKGAYGNYETDYYYLSQTEASEWLLKYLKAKKIDGKIRVSATYSVEWMFRDNPQVETSWFRFEERSMHDWDYAIVVNRYIPPYQLKNKIWPPADALHIIYAEGVPLCAVIERKTKDDFYGYEALVSGRFSEASEYLRKAVDKNGTDEMIFYNFAAALYKNGDQDGADSSLKKCLELNPDFELALMYLGNIAREKRRIEEASAYYERVIHVNRKYFEAYVSLAELRAVNNVQAARKLLRECLLLNPGFKPAIIALGDTYSKSDTEIARKYYEQAKTVN
jgi:tetratricopeptide (TPR) repeat protein